MKPFYLTLLFFALLAVVWGEPALGKHAPYSYHGPKNSKQVAFARGPNNKQKTLVVQIRSDQPVPLVLKGRPNLAHSHAAHTHAHAHSHAHAHGHVLTPHHLSHSHVHHHINAGATHLRGQQRPIKLQAAQSYMKNPTFQRKPLKIKLTNTKTKLSPVHKPATSYDVPFKYEIPTIQSQTYSDLQQLPLDHHHFDFISDNFAPIHTIPAPNLSIQDNHLHPEETYLPPSTPKPQVYHQQKYNYQVNEESTNDQTYVDTLSGSQKLVAPDPDPSLPAAPVRPATEPFNTPSNGKPLPVDIQSNHLSVAQPLLQIVGAQAGQQLAPEIYPIQYTQPIAAIQAAAPVPIYNPTYLVQQSNNLYSQHQQQLFKPAIDAVPVVAAGYVNADLTQEVASNGQILQAAKDPHNNIHPVLDVAPHFAPLIAAPSLDEEQSIDTAPFHLQNLAGPTSAITGTTEAGFVVSNYYGNAHQDSSQLLQAYVEEEQAEAQRQQYEQQLQQQQQLQLQQQQQQEQLHLQQQQLHQQQLEYQQLQQFHQQQQQFQQQHPQYVTPQPQQQALVQPQRHQQQDPAAAAFEEHQRLVQQQLGADTPLRIFVPDEEEARLQKRSDNIVKGTIEDVENTIGVEDEQPQDELYEVSSSVEVSSEDQQQQQQYEQQTETSSNEAE
ncbi:putative uncharacterized protein DDB_G0268364 isoform X1 [Lucilia cuprina]|uniref:putative uncharacterized protein DDB_G0268364 isoform X1 n=1 Tax=Lucilia cuprina TaxID=7375 RepID=UPI001F0640BB|nr:putative uncharacterized protein DDB_G0268364 isoform X1 [Lucilia cuprina]